MAGRGRRRKGPGGAKDTLGGPVAAWVSASRRHLKGGFDVIRRKVPLVQRKQGGNFLFLFFEYLFLGARIFFLR